MGPLSPGQSCLGNHITVIYELYISDTEDDNRDDERGGQQGTRGERPRKPTSVKEKVIWRPLKPNQGAGGGFAKLSSKYFTQRGELEKPF